MDLSIKKSFLISLGVHLSIFLVIAIIVLFQPNPVADITNLVTVETEVSGMSSGEIAPVNRKMDTGAKLITEPVVKPRPARQKNTQKLLASMKTSKNGTSQPVSDDGTAERKALEARRVSNEQAQLETQEMDKVSGDVDKALNETEGASGNQNSAVRSGTGGNDPLGDSGWSLRPRKTVFFPNIQAKIPVKYKKKGMSYAITAKITFDHYGLAARVDILASSGDATIDNIFFSELKKVRVEPIPENRTDVITKRFSISLK